MLKRSAGDFKINEFSSRELEEEEASLKALITQSVHRVIATERQAKTYVNTIITLIKEVNN